VNTQFPYRDDTVGANLIDYGTYRVNTDQMVRQIKWVAVLSGLAGALLPATVALVTMAYNGDVNPVRSLVFAMGCGLTFLLSLYCAVVLTFDLARDIRYADRANKAEIKDRDFDLAILADRLIEKNLQIESVRSIVRAALDKRNGSAAGGSGGSGVSAMPPAANVILWPVIPKHTEAKK
jgi:hypothetical protein